MANFRRLIATLAICLPLMGCGGGDGEGAAGDAQQVANAPQVPAQTGNEPLLPLPRPEGDRSIGARIWEYQIEVTRDTVPAGDLVFHVVNAGTTEHWLIVRDDTLFEATPHLFPGDSAVLRVTLEPGEYNLVCTIRDEFDHISEGERRMLTVR